MQCPRDCQCVQCLGTTCTCGECTGEKITCNNQKQRVARKSKDNRSASTTL